MRRIMSYYQPKWVAWLGGFVSVLNSATSAMFGFIFAQLLFILMRP
jgi:hypothetical protein